MTTLEVVEAVQRALEHEGFLQNIRAQLRANVLKIISNGPNYVPQTGAIVQFGTTRTGAIALALVRDMLSHAGMRESLAVFEAEAGLGEDSNLREVCNELNISPTENYCLLELLISNALGGGHNRPGNATPATAEKKLDSPMHHSQAKVSMPSAEESQLEEQSIEEEPEDEYDQEDSFVQDDDDARTEGEGEGYSAIDATEPPSAKKDSPAEPSSPSLPSVRPTIFSGALAAAVSASNSRLDESSSFEAESPGKAQTIVGQHPGRQGAPLEESFAEEVGDEDDVLEEDEVNYGEEKEQDQAESKQADTSGPVHMELKGEQEDRGSDSAPQAEEAEAEEGPEYDSAEDENRSHGPAASDDASIEKVDAREDEKDDVPQRSGSKSSDEGERSGQFGSLRAAREEDFDRLDRSGGFGAGTDSRASARNRIAVRRANDAATEDDRDSEPTLASRANVNRLGQAAVSRSQRGWDTTEDTKEQDDFEVESDDDDGRVGAARVEGHRGGGDDMETESFEQDDSPVRSQPARSQVRNEPVRRSNNQEEEEEHSEASGSVVEDFEVGSGSGSDGEFEHAAYVPSGSRPAAGRNAFASPEKAAPVKQAVQQDVDEGDEYSDEGFDDEEDEKDEGSAPASPAAPPQKTQSLFSAPPARAAAASSQRYGEDEDSVEESIPDEEEEEDGMSVGQDSDEDSGDDDFRHTVKGRGSSQQQKQAGAGLSRAGPSGALPGLNRGAAGKNKAFDAVLNSFEDSDEGEAAPPAAGQSGRGAGVGSSNITARMREIDSKLEDMERTDTKGELAKLRQQHQQRGGDDDDNSVASENIDEMEFSTGGGQESDESGEGYCLPQLERTIEQNFPEVGKTRIVSSSIVFGSNARIDIDTMDKMLTKFESKSNRVKGLSFHPVRPWILASLHNGHIQLWDYRMGSMLDKFEEHDGPVRGVDFHRTQPLIVSGGDDYKVKVWDYKLRRCLFTLLGHLDYIRTVQFHVEYPWIVSASDDQTIRIWNWQSRHCISVLTGHNHYVMCAAFHPKEDMIVSASLDQTVRVWDTTGLRKKTVRGAPPQMDEGNVVSRVNNELFGGNDAVVKYVLEGHERGVNWASFHPTLPLVISGADDRQVKLWRMNETKAWEVDTMRGHTNNVSCVLFHPKHELIVSNSEDRTIRVWDISKRLGVQTFRREGDRFWILGVHPEQNLLAAGHDSGMTVFKLERERPAHDTLSGKCFYVKDRYLRMHEFHNARDVPLVSLRRTTSNATPGIGGGPRTLSYNVFNKGENNVLITSDADGGTYELLTFSTDSTGSGDAQDVRRGNGISAVFLARDRFAVLDKSRQLLIKNFQNEVVKKSTPPVAGVDGLFFGGTSGRLLMKTEDRVIMFDTQARKVLSEIQAPRIKYIFWNADYSMVALMAKHTIVLANKNFEQLCTINETVRLKGGGWDATNQFFVFTSLNHVKYVLPNADRGIIRGVEGPVYTTKVQGNTLYCLDREGKMRTMEIDTTEALFKLALERKDYAEVMRIVKHSRLCGQAIISYLQEKGYPEVALHFVHDAKTRFKLALACGNIQVAMNVAYDLGDDAWRQLGVEALRQGNHEVVEMSYQKTKEFDALSFLYLLTGNTEKLRKMQKIAEMRGDAMSCVHNALYLGDAEERVKIIEMTGQLALAYLTARTHGLHETADRLLELLHSSGIAVPEVDPNATLLLPPTPIYRSENWPQLAVGKSAVAAGAEGGGGISSMAMDGDEFHDAQGGGSWGDDDDLFDDEGGAEKKAAATESKGGKAASGWGDDDLEISDDEAPAPSSPSKGSVETSRNADGSIFTVPNAGNPPTIAWCAESSHCADHFAAGSADSAVQLLNRQVAATNVAPLKAGATSLFVGASAFLPGFPLAPSNRSYLVRDTGKPAPGTAPKTFPALTLKVTALLEQLKQAYRAFTNAQLAECQASLEDILHSILLISVTARTESNDLKELLDVSREYLIALRVKKAMDGVAAEDVGRGLELAAYFTHCNLQPSHLVLALKTAMASAFKNKNFINAASFARRLLELPDMNSEKNADARGKAQKVLQKSEQQGRNEFTIDYDERNPFSLDCSNLKPLYKGTPLVKCSYCSANYAVDYRGKRCLICNIATVGLDTVGLVTQSTAARAHK